MSEPADTTDPEIPRWKVTRTWYVWGPETEADAIADAKRMPHLEVHAERVPLPPHEEAVSIPSGTHVCARDGQTWPCTAAMAAGAKDGWHCVFCGSPLTSDGDCTEEGDHTHEAQLASRTPEG